MRTPATPDATDTADAEYRRLLALLAATGATLARGGGLRPVLQRCAEALVEHLDAAFARIWVLDDAESLLILEASAGMYTHLDGAHARIPLGELKIGAIATEQRPHLTNEVLGDPRVSDQKWVRATGMRAFAGHPLVVDGRTVGVMALFARAPLGEPVLRHLGSVADAVAQFVDRDRTERRFRQREEELTRAHEDAVLEERRRLARELHDSVSQALYGVVLGTRTVRDALGPAGDPAAAAAALDSVAEMAEVAAAEMRALVVALHPRALDELGLVGTLRLLADAAARRGRVDVLVEAGAEPELGAALREALYRIAQEALHNAIRHARATRVVVRLTSGGDTVRLDVEDDGGGFDALQAHPGHLGLRSMRERADAAGADLEITSRPGGGTAVRATAALRPPSG